MDKINQMKTLKVIKNRYNDVFTFKLDEDDNILWMGDFTYCRYAWPNDYSYAYSMFKKDGGKSTLDDFIVKVHEYNTIHGYTEVAKKYGCLVASKTNEISMVDPSGGPYYSIGMEIEGFVIESFERTEDGYKIITKK